MTRARRKTPPGKALYAFDAAWILERGGPLAGADEAGRGSLAGPLVAAAVILDGTVIPCLDDSKVLSPARRAELFEELIGRAEAVSVTMFPAWWIDLHGLGAANREVLTRSIGSLDSWAGCGLADGNLKLGPDVECLPRADGFSAAVAAASVVAKVLRDHAMHALSACHPGYGFERNRGYGTREHRMVLAEAGPCRVHRMSFAGVGI
ncbi:MAG: ribonuclease HII [Rubrobacteraceae bacterium]